MISVSPALAEGRSYKYKVAANPTVPKVGDVCKTGYTAWNGNDEITAESGKTIVIVEVDAESVCAGAGTATVVSLT